MENQEIQQPEQTPEKRLSLRFQIPYDDYLAFHLLMTAADRLKARRRSVVLGSIEIVVGLVFLLLMASAKARNSTLTWGASILLVVLGAFQIIHYRFLYEKAIAKSLRRQYDATPYFQQGILLDFYPNKVVELVNGEENATYWHTISGIQENDRLLIIMLEPKRCILIPKREVKEQWETLDTLLDEVCESYEKARRQI